MSRLRRRARIALALRVWPWAIPAAVVDQAGLDRPPESVFEEFRRIHGLPERGGVSPSGKERGE